MKLLEQQLAWQGGGGLLAHVRDSTSGWSTPVGTGSGTMPLREDAIIEIASISKVLTGLLLASMVGQGEVTLDQPVAELLPASVHVPIHQGRAITLLDLATATAGLPRLPSNLQPANPADPYADYGAQDLYDFLSGYTLTRAPGATYEYSNLGMGLLGHALALRLGMSYEQAVIERVLHPLGMHDTRITLTPQQAARMVQGHDGELKPVPAWTEGVLAGAYAWRSTLADMRRLANTAIDPPPGETGDMLWLAMKPQREVAPGMSIGLAWHILTRNGHVVTWHNGQSFGVHTFLGVDRSRKRGVVLLGNVATDTDDLALHLLDASFPLAERAATVAVAPEVLENYVGTYNLAPGFDIVVSREADRLYVQATDQPRFPVYPTSLTRFALRVIAADIEFTVDDDGTATGLVLHQGGQSVPGRKTAGR